MASCFLLNIPELQSDLIVLPNITDKLIVNLRLNMLEKNQISTFVLTVCSLFVLHIKLL